MTDAAPASPQDRSELEEAQRLLAAALKHVLQHGYQELSLRAMAEQLKTSHRMLIYYFGSADGFWEALLRHLRRTRIKELARQSARRQMPSIEAVWAELSSPQHLAMFRLMFQIYGKALGQPDRYQDFLRQVVDEWLHTLTEDLIAHHDWPRDHARLQARLRLAVIRGLMLDLLTTGDHEGATQAVALFAERMTSPLKKRGG